LSHTFSAWREGLPIYLTPIVFGLALAGVGLAWGSYLSLGLGVPLLLLGAYALFFFRDPKRAVPSDPSAVLSGADGTVVGIEDLEETPYHPGPCKRVSVFLSLFDVHVNRAPVAGTVKDVRYRPGKFLDARRSETTDVNEAMTILLDTKHGPVTVRQISGLVARRIVCRCAVGDRLEAGEKFGMIKFGSRTEVYLPPQAEVLVALGDKVKAGETVVARIA